MNDIEVQLEKLRRLPDRTGPTDRVRPTDEAIEAAAAFAECCVIVPYGNGGIELSWETPDLEMEVQFSADGSFRSALVDHDGVIRATDSAWPLEHGFEELE